MSDLSPEDRALVDVGGRDDAPSGAERDRVRRRLAVRLGAGAGLGIATAATKTAAATSAVTSLTMKVVLGAVLIGVVGAGGAALGIAVRGSARTTATTATAPVATTAPATTAPATTAAAEAVASPIAPPLPASAMVVIPVEAGTAPTTPAPGSVGPRATAAAVAPRQDDVSAVPTTSVDALAEETRLLRDANAATRAGEPARALGLLEEHARRFPGGILGEERDAERVLALCAAGRTAEARAAAQRFLSARPGSALAGRVRSSCGGM